MSKQKVKHGQKLYQYKRFIIYLKNKTIKIRGNTPES